MPSTASSQTFTSRVRLLTCTHPAVQNTAQQAQRAVGSVVHSTQLKHTSNKGMLRTHNSVRQDLAIAYTQLSMGWQAWMMTIISIRAGAKMPLFCHTTMVRQSQGGSESWVKLECSSPQSICCTAWKQFQSGAMSVFEWLELGLCIYGTCPCQRTSVGCTCSV